MNINVRYYLNRCVNVLKWVPSKMKSLDEWMSLSYWSNDNAACCIMMNLSVLWPMRVGCMSSLEVPQRRQPSYRDVRTAGDVQLLQSVLEDVEPGQGPVVHLRAAPQRQGAQRVPHWRTTSTNEDQTLAWTQETALKTLHWNPLENIQYLKKRKRKVYHPSFPAPFGWWVCGPSPLPPTRSPSGAQSPSWICRCCPSGTTLAGPRTWGDDVERMFFFYVLINYSNRLSFEKFNWTLKVNSPVTKKSL